MGAQLEGKEEKMTCKLKVGFVVIAVLATSAVAASAAQAEYNLTLGTPPITHAVLTGEQIAHEKGNKLEITSRGTRVECKTVTYEGTVEEGSVADVNVTPKYEGCTVNGSLKANVDVNGCTITLTGETNGAKEGIVHLLCPEGKKIEITIPEISCTLAIHEQTPTSGGVTYTNKEGTPDDVEATANLGGITYERIGTSLGCVAAAPKEGNDATLLSKATLRAYEDIEGKEGEQADLTVDVIESSHYLLTLGTPPITHAVLTGEQIAHEKGNKLEITSRGTRVECKTVTYEGTVEEGSVADVNVTPKYEGCTANGELEAKVDVNGCTITLTGETNGSKEGIVHLLCPEGKKIEITIPGISCTLVLHEQTPTSGGVTYTNKEGIPDDIEATANLGGITYERIGTSTGCVAAAPKEGNDATLLSKATLRAYEDIEGKEGEQADLTVDVIESSHYLLTLGTPPITHAVLTGEQIAHEKGNKLEITSRGTRVECKTVTYEGTVEEGSVADVNVTPKYEGCTANGELEAKVDVNGCTITLTGETNGSKEGIVHLLCPEGKKIEITIPGISCTLVLHEQTPTSGGVTYTNKEGTPDDVEATANLGGITYERIGTSLGCVAAAPKEGNDATLLSKATLRAYEDIEGKEGEQADLTVDVIESSHYLLTLGTPPITHAVLTGEQIAHEKGNKLEITSRGTRVECKTVTYEGTVEEGSVADVNVTPNYEGCTANGELEAKVDVNGCTITLTGETNGAGQGIVHLLCPEGKRLEITIPGISCTLAIHEQTPTSWRGHLHQQGRHSRRRRSDSQPGRHHIRTNRHHHRLCGRSAERGKRRHPVEQGDTPRLRRHRRQRGGTGRAERGLRTQIADARVGRRASASPPAQVTSRSF